MSNFDTDDMEGVLAAGGTRCATDQILYNITRRGPEYELVGWLADKQIPLMAYSPVEQGRLPKGGALAEVAAKHRATIYQVALAWLLAKPHVVAIPKAATVDHVKENRRAASLALDAGDMAALDAAFPPPRRKQRLEML